MRTFSFGCPYLRRRSEGNSGKPKVAAAEFADLRYRKDLHEKEIGGECSICLSAFADGERLRQLRGCKHWFHGNCIDLWLSNHSNCPICRATVASRKRTKSSASASDRDMHQGLPDASGLL